ncbi:hypothetical protein Tco_0656366, partial [Tanacetum coccineum]
MPVTHPEEVEETIGIPIEVEPLNETKLEEVGLNCNHNTPLSSREDPSFDKPEPQPQPSPNYPPLDARLGTERGFKPPVKPQSPNSFRMKVLDNLTIHTPPSSLVASFHLRDLYCYYRPCVDDLKKHYGFKPGDDWKLESEEVFLLERGLNSLVRPKYAEKNVDLSGVASCDGCARYVLENQLLSVSLLICLGKCDCVERIPSVFHMAKQIILVAQLVPKFQGIRRCNNYVVLQSIPCSPECKIVGQILLDHPLCYALTATADVSAVFKLDAQEITYTVDMFRDALKLPVETPDNPFITPVNIKIIESFIQRVGYQGVVDKVSVFYTKFLAQPWQTIRRLSSSPQRLDEDYHSIKDDIPL